MLCVLGAVAVVLAQGMGFDAVWISPVVSNVGCGYHGYWAQNLYEIEQHFGGKDALLSMMNAAHKAGVAVMLDIGEASLPALRPRCRVRGKAACAVACPALPGWKTGRGQRGTLV